MIQKYLLLIDDQPRSAELERIKDILKNDQIELVYKEYSPASFSTRENEDVVFDKNAFIQELNQLPYFRRLDSILCDYNLGDIVDDGIKIIQIIKEENPNYKKQIVLYSAKIQDVYRKICAENNDKILGNILKQLIVCKVEFIERDINFDQKVIKHIKKEKLFSFEEELIKWFYSRKDDEFNCLFPKYQGKKFEDIARCLKVDSQDSIEFKKELVEQVIAYLSKINGLS